MVSLGVIPDIFVGEADDCERIVAALQYCSFLPIPAVNGGGLSRPLTMHVITSMLEKGVLYRNMLDLKDVQLLQKCYYVTQKFTEFGERLEILDTEIDITKLSLRRLINGLLMRINSIHEFQVKDAPLLKIFQLVKLHDLYLIFHPNFLNVEESVVVVISESATIINFSWNNHLPLVDTLIEVLTPLLVIQEYVVCSVVCLLRDVSTLRNSFSHIDKFKDREGHDDQLLALHDFLKDAKRTEGRSSVETMENALRGIHQSLAQENREALLEYIQHGRYPHLSPDPKPVQREVRPLFDHPEPEPVRNDKHPGSTSVSAPEHPALRRSNERDDEDDEMREGPRSVGSSLPRPMSPPRDTQRVSVTASSSSAWLSAQYSDDDDSVRERDSQYGRERGIGSMTQGVQPLYEGEREDDDEEEEVPFNPPPRSQGMPIGNSRPTSRPTSVYNGERDRDMETIPAFSDESVRYRIVEHYDLSTHSPSPPPNANGEGYHADYDATTVERDRLRDRERFGHDYDSDAYLDMYRDMDLDSSAVSSVFRFDDRDYWEREKEIGRDGYRDNSLTLIEERDSDRENEGESEEVVEGLLRETSSRYSLGMTIGGGVSELDMLANPNLYLKEDWSPAIYATHERDIERPMSSYKREIEEERGIYSSRPLSGGRPIEIQREGVGSRPSTAHRTVSPTQRESESETETEPETSERDRESVPTLSTGNTALTASGALALANARALLDRLQFHNILSDEKERERNDTHTDIHNDADTHTDTDKMVRESESKDTNILRDEIKQYYDAKHEDSSIMMATEDVSSILPDIGKDTHYLSINQTALESSMLLPPTQIPNTPSKPSVIERDREVMITGDRFVTKSVLGQLMASEDGDSDIMSYAHRAYALIRDKAVAEAVKDGDLLSDSVSLSHSQSLVGQTYAPLSRPSTAAGMLPMIAETVIEDPVQYFLDRESLVEVSERERVRKSVEDKASVSSNITTGTNSRPSTARGRDRESDSKTSRSASPSGSASVRDDKMQSLFAEEKPYTSTLSSRPPSANPSIAASAKDSERDRDGSSSRYCAKDSLDGRRSTALPANTSIPGSMPVPAVPVPATVSIAESKISETESYRYPIPTVVDHDQDGGSVAASALTYDYSDAEGDYGSILQPSTHTHSRAEIESHSHTHMPTVTEWEHEIMDRQQKHDDVVDIISMNANRLSQSRSRSYDDQMLQVDMTAMLQTSTSRTTALPSPANMAAPMSMSRPQTAGTVKQQIVVDQLRALQSNIEYDFLQNQLKRNQRRLRVGKLAFQALQQQREREPLNSTLAWQQREALTGLSLPPANSIAANAPPSAPSPASVTSASSAARPLVVSRQPSTVSAGSASAASFVPQIPVPPPAVPMDFSRSHSQNNSRSNLSLAPSAPASYVQSQQPTPLSVSANPWQSGPSSPNLGQLRSPALASLRDERERIQRDRDRERERDRAANKAVAWEVDLDNGGASGPGTRSRSRPRSAGRFQPSREKERDREAPPSSAAQSPSKLPVPVSARDRDRDRESEKVAPRSSSGASARQPVNVQVVSVASVDAEESVLSAYRKERDREPSPNRVPLSARGPSSATPQQTRSTSAGGQGRPTSRNAGRPGAKESGPKLSNYAQAKNAITHVCLAGGHQEDRRVEVLDLLDYYYCNSKTRGVAPTLSPDCVALEELKGQVSHFLLMFHKSKSLAFKGVYILDSGSKSIIRVYGKGPATLTENDPQIKEYMKFETSSKAFRDLPVRTISSTVDAIILEPPKQKVPF